MTPMVDAACDCGRVVLVSQADVREGAPAICGVCG